MGARGRGVSHLPELDGVRGFAILIVMALHFVCSQIGTPTSRIEALAMRLTGYGDWGVDLFFVLSGFLITGILWETRGSEGYFKTFYARRTLRIFPLYYATLLVALVLIPGGVAQQYAPELLKTREFSGWLWTYTSNVYLAGEKSFDIPYLSHFWTLAIEEHFYLVWPFIVGLCSRTTALRVCVGASLFALGLRVTLDLSYPDLLASRVLTPCRLDSLCIGAWLALLIRGPGGIEACTGLAKRGLVLSALGVVGLSLWRVPGHAIRPTVLALFFGFAILLGAWDQGPKALKWFLRMGWLRFLGKYSYGLYVFHGILAYAMFAHGTLAYVQKFVSNHFAAVLVQGVIGTALSIAISLASYELFEARFLSLKKRYEPKFAKATEPSAATAGEQA